MIPTILGVTVISFSMIHFVPGDPAVLLAGSEATQEIIEKIRENYGLNKPLVTQYLEYMARLVRGDFGISIWTRKPVSELLAQRYWVTMKLALMSIVIAFVVGIFPGVIAATRQYSFFDYFSMVVTLFWNFDAHFLDRPSLDALFLCKTGPLSCRRRNRPLHPCPSSHQPWRLIGSPDCPYHPHLHAGGDSPGLCADVPGPGDDVRRSGFNLLGHGLRDALDPKLKD